MTTNSELIDRLATRSALSDVAACLPHLLDALAWDGTPRQMGEALTGPLASMDGHALRNTLANLGYRSRSRRLRLGAADVRLLPCLFVPDGGGIGVMWVSGDGRARCFDGRTRESFDFGDGDIKGTAYVFQRDERADGQERPETRWLRVVARRFERFGIRILGLTVLLNLVALATPLFVMFVFDRVIGSGDTRTLAYLAIGVGLALAFDGFLRLLRGALLAYLGGRWEMLIGVAAVGAMLDLPLARLERSSVATQIDRLSTIEETGRLFTGPLALAVIELPFAVVFLAAIAIIGGWVALVPATLIGVLAATGIVGMRQAGKAVEDSVRSRARARSLLVEMLSHAPAIKTDGTEGLWKERFRRRSTRLAMSNLKTARIGAVVGAAGQFIMVFTGAATLTAGSYAAFTGAMTLGALIASMVLAMRALAPLTMLFVALTRLVEVKTALHRLDRLMAEPAETGIRGSARIARRERRFHGRITFADVVLRYRANHEPALAGISFDVRPGEVVAITGASGAGKSSILKLIVDLYRPEAGIVLVDGVDTRQIDHLQLRHGVAYLTQRTHLFSGSIAENLRLANPVATDEEIEDACLRAGIWEEVRQLPDGLDEVVSGRPPHRFSCGFQRGLGVARTLLTGSGIMLFDEADGARDTGSDIAFIEEMKRMKGTVTALVVTRRPAQIQVADRVIAMDRGTIAYDGSPQAISRAAVGAA